MTDKRTPRSTVILAAALAVMTGVAAVLGYLYWDATRTSSAGNPSEIAATAAKYATTVSTYTYENFDAHFDAVAEIATPEFREQYEAAATELREFLNEAEGTSEGTAEYAATYRESDGEAEVLVFLDQEVRNVIAPDGRVDKSRLLVTLHHVDGRWLLHDIGGV